MLSDAEKNVVARALKPDGALGRVGTIGYGIWIISSLILSCCILGPYLLLVVFYGFFRVHQQQLHFTYSPSAKSVDDFIVSNGDHITKADALIGVPIDVVIWGALTLAGYWIIKRLSRWQREARLRKLIREL